MFTKLKFITAGALLSMYSLTPQAIPIGYDIGFTGSGGYTMEGMFSFDDSLLGTGAITGSSLDTFTIDVLLNGGSVGTWDFFADGLVSGLNFNFNFDTTSEQFIVGGFSASASGQDWNVMTGGNGCTPTIGFSSGSGSQGVCVGGSFTGSVPIGQPTLVATRKVDAPEPGILALLSIGLFGMLLVRRRFS